VLRDIKFLFRLIQFRHLYEGLVTWIWVISYTAKCDSIMYSWLLMIVL